MIPYPWCYLVSWPRSWPIGIVILILCKWILRLKGLNSLPKLTQMMWEKNKTKVSSVPVPVFFNPFFDIWYDPNTIFDHVLFLKKEFWSTYYFLHYLQQVLYLCLTWVFSFPPTPFIHEWDTVCELNKSLKYTIIDRTLVSERVQTTLLLLILDTMVFSLGLHVQLLLYPLYY